MKRNIDAQLKLWKKSPGRLPLIIQGARQIGKTYTLKAFGASEFANMLYVNLEIDDRARQIFTDDLKPRRIIEELSAYLRMSVHPASTLIVFDEVQACERALTSLKYFAEDAPEYFVVAAGSLLGVAMTSGQFSFPVGKARILPFFPLDFGEFLRATGNAELASRVELSFATNEQLPVALHGRALDLYHDYVIVGGMPAAVNAYVANQYDWQEIRERQMLILDGYYGDAAKYATAAEAVKIRTAFGSVPAQLAKDNRKFQYKLLKKGASASHFGATLDWLKQSGTVLECRRLEQACRPLVANVDLSAFKLYYCDVGLLSAKSNVTRFDLQHSNAIQSTFMGAIAENYVATQLCANGHDLYYWESHSIAEIDFVIEKAGMIYPVEVKAADNVRSRSLGVFCEKYQPDYSIRLSTRNFGFENGIKSIPLYAAHLI